MAGKNDLVGIILAGGSGTRLHPVTDVASKQLQPIFNKPMIYYALTTMLLAGISEVLIISSPADTPRFEALLGDARKWGIHIRYAVQPEPKGIAQALTIGAEFVGRRSVMLLLGDNLLYGRLDFLRQGVDNNGSGATIFAYQVGDPKAYGVVEFDADFKVLSLEEKPEHPRSNWAVPGLYVYGPGVAERVAHQQPSARGELEITDLNRDYLVRGQLRAVPMGRGIAWLDTGTPEAMLDAASFVHAVEMRTGFLVGSPEEAAYRTGFIDLEQLAALTQAMPRNSSYRQALERVVKEARREW